MGPCGSGKSECALDLIIKGHRFVGDDMMRIEKKTDGTLIAFSPSPEGFPLSIRGVGIIDVEKIYGVSSVARQMPVDLVIELIEQDNPNAFDLVGDAGNVATILDVSVIKKILPAQTRGSLANIIELVVKKTFISSS